MQSKYYANGKLLITGEYLVMFGTEALAIPTKYGQSMLVNETTDSSSIKWTSKESGKTWFNAVISCDLLKIEETSDLEIAKRLSGILIAAKELNSSFLTTPTGYEIVTELNFNRNWGLGTSSTLISNIASWARVDPFQLLRKISKGSGYDIACAREEKPLLYKLSNQIPTYKRVDFNPPFKDHIYFVYLNQKQNTEQSISNMSHLIEKKSEIQEITQITNEFAKAKNLRSAQKLIAEHEIIISHLINQEPVQSLRFKDFQGVIKSLGAWGGDFVMVLTELTDKQVRTYFSGQNLQTVLPWNEVAL